MIEHLHRIAAHAYYCDEHDAGRRACERLLRMDLSPEKEEKVRANRTWYTQRLDELVEVKFKPLTPGVYPGWSRFNPSVVIQDSVPLFNVRSSNYLIDENGRYVIPPEDGETIRTRNLLYDGLVAMPIYATYPRSAFPVDGLEDVRLNVIDGKLIASATVRDYADQDGTCRIAYGTVADGWIHDLTCHDTENGVHEKNWMPILGQDRWLYSCSARGHVALVHDAGDEWRVEAYAKSPPVARAFRGGSQVVPIGGPDWLAVVHEVAVVNGRRVYEHRFVMFDETDWSIRAVSEPFAFRETRTIEFAAGLAVNDRKAIVTFGVRDAEAWVAEIPVLDVLGLMDAT